ncbi:uncharacterized protein PV09_02598 [Verruconis gallopava]|uniref:Protein with SprT-like domain at the N terminus n=1 Tax=Verruconis gallopava TaxID=253628 RepID=A0A0D1XVZ6_9PEZI|nr:uncharacterized protein PV09_02598 [Verruconis gallopava]KIW06936.1 hypothetical protein PV09_02598 [Verruconis gallopava]
MQPTTDEDAALAAIAAFSQLTPDQQDAQAKIATIRKEEDANPFVNIHELFALYDVLYFRSLLVSKVDISWSSRLTLCAGMCEISKDQEGKYTRIKLKMSEPLLKYRTRSDTINTLLHEAIHAYLFITTGWRHARGGDGTGHGKGFQLLADAISNHGGYEVTVFHKFHEEVDSYRTHIWKCDGPCQNQPPFFGFVKRSMNRPPSKNDPWWDKHQEECGGKYTKIAEPAPTKAQLSNMTAKARAGRQKNKIDSWVRKSNSDEKEEAEKPGRIPSSIEHLYNSFLVSNNAEHVPSKAVSMSNVKRERTKDDQEAQPRKKMLVNCPICDERIDEAMINQHLDNLHDL